MATGSIARRGEPVAVVSMALLNGRRLFWLLQCGGWLAFGAVMYAWGLAYWTPLDAFWNKAILVAVGFAMTLGFAGLYQRATVRDLPRIVLGVMILACSFIGAALWAELQAILFQAYFNAAHREGAIGRGHPGFGTLLFYGFVLLSWSLLYYGIENWDALLRERHRAERAEAHAQAARLRALQAQLNPHFFFNALNIASTLIDEGHAAEAKQMLARLSEFLRLTLDTLDTPEILVAEEIKFVRSYLDIERVRFGARLQTSIDVSADVMNALVPTLILQPLIENALKHGILSHELGGSLNLGITSQDGELRITLTDSGRGVAAESAPGRGMGLTNTSRRLQELYGDAAELDFAKTEGGGLTRLTLPLRAASGAAHAPEAAP